MSSKKGKLLAGRDARRNDLAEALFGNFNLFDAVKELVLIINDRQMLRKTRD